MEFVDAEEKEEPPAVYKNVFEEEDEVDDDADDDADDDSESDEEDHVFRRGSSVLKGSADAANDVAFTDLDVMRADNESSKRFSIMAEVFTEEEEAAFLKETEGAAKGDPESDVQFKRMSIRVSAKNTTPYRKCTFVRESGTISSKFFPQYHMYLDDEKGRLLIAARKLTRNRNASYYLFDMSMQSDVSKCGRDSPNLIGKLVKKNFECTELVLVRDNDEFAGLVFFRPPNEDMFGASHPRNITAMVPKLDEIGNTNPHDVTTNKSLTQMVLDKDKSEEHLELRSKDPIFYNGCYRLHFLGKTAVQPSVKNFQLTPAMDPTQVLVQFVKLTEDKYRLDFQAPVTAAQAFVFALAQFNRL